MIVLLLFVYLKTYEQSVPFQWERPKSNKELKEEAHQQYIKNVVLAIMRQESNDGTELYSSAVWENAVGVLQIRPVMLKHINRDILGYNAFTLNDRLDSLKSVEMFLIYQNKHNPTMDFEVAAKIWNGGPTGMRKTATIKYFNSVKKHMQTIAMK